MASKSFWFYVARAFFVAEAVFVFLVCCIPSTYQSTGTDIVGIPAFLNFNVDRRFWFFYLQAVGVPLAMALQLWRIPFPPVRRELEITFPVLGASFFRAFFLGTTLALPALILDAGSPWHVVVFGLLYAFLAAASGRATRMNTWLSPLACLLPVAAATATTVQVRETTISLGHWFPFWLGMLFVAVAYAWLGCRRRDPKLEEKALLRIVCPALIFFLAGQIRFISAELDFTHDGEYLVSGDYFWKGLFPWRDFNLVRGFLGECLKPWVGFSLFGNSLWGSRAGEALWLTPLLLVFRYCFTLYVTRGNLFLLFFGVRLFQDPVLPLFSVQYFSLLFQPLLWILFFELARRRTTAWAVLFAAAAFLNAALSVEGLVFGAATSCVLLLWDRKLFWKTHATYLVAAGIGAAFLAAHDALAAYLSDLDASVVGRRFFHGYPFQWSEGWAFRLGVLLPLLCIFYVAAHHFAKWKRAQKLDAWDIGMAAIALFVLLDYQKFLSTPDGHIFEVTTECLPIVLWAASHWLRRPAVYFALTVLALLTYPISLRDRAELLTQQYRRDIARPSTVPRLDLLGPNPPLEKMVHDFAKVFQGRVGPRDTVYDFTNRKGLFYYLLELKPVSRFVYTGYKPASHREVLAALRANPPKYVVYSGGIFWDQGGIPNSVRFAEISEYLLENYEPMVALHGTILLQARPKGVPSSTALYGWVPACDFGYVPFVFRRATEKAGRASPPILDVGARENVRYLDVAFDESVPGELALSDDPSVPGKIRFKVAASGPSLLRLRVAACPQWLQFTGNKIYLQSTPEQKISGLSAVRKFP